MFEPVIKEKGHPFEGITREGIENRLLGLDDTFPFHCRSCGKCCHHRYDIVLTGFDLFRIAQFFSRTPQEIVKSYCTQEGNLVPAFLLKARPNGDCPFLRKKKCAVHPIKPTVCRVFPLARVFMGNDGAIFDPDKLQWGYLLMEDVDCNSKDRLQSVREWVGPEGTEEYTRIAQKWHTNLLAFRTWADHYAPLIPIPYLQRVHDLFEKYLFLNYDIQQPFEEQLEKNTAELKDFLLQVTQLCNTETDEVTHDEA